MLISTRLVFNPSRSVVLSANNGIKSQSRVNLVRVSGDRDPMSWRLDSIAFPTT
jgi:hypothetical protein